MKDDDLALLVVERSEKRLHLGDGATQWNDQLLMARRLVEAGCRVVTVAYGFWDTHGGNFRYLKSHLPLFDTGISSLVEDIYARGLENDVTVCVWGEFGRTPKINKEGGRDHWGYAGSIFYAGGGVHIGSNPIRGFYPAIAGTSGTASWSRCGSPAMRRHSSSG